MFCVIITQIFFSNSIVLFFYCAANDTFLLVLDSQSIKLFNPWDLSEQVIYDASLNLLPSNIVAVDYDSV